jgi:hypothetical protein
MNHPFQENDLFVSIEGNDKWSGGLPAPNADRTDGPLATVDAARKKIRAIKQAGRLAGSLTVWIRGGRYYLSKPLVFEPQDSGPITYSAYPGEAPVFDGSTPISQWKEERLGQVRVWTADVSAILEKHGPFRQLFAAGRRRPRARLPKQDYYWIENLPGKDLTCELFDGSDRFQVAPGDMRTWRNLTDVEIVAMHFWTEERMPVTAFDEQTRLVRSKWPSIFKLVDDIGNRCAKYYIDNVFEGLSDPGEWYLDQPQGTLYYIPEEGETPETAGIVVSNCYQFLKLMGEPENGKWVEYLTFAGLAFEYADWLQPYKVGYRFDPCLPPEEWRPHPACQLSWRDKIPAEAAAVPQAAYKVPGVIYFLGSRNCALEDCRIEHIGCYAVDIADGCTGNRIVGNQMSDLGGGGIKVCGSSAEGPVICRTGSNVITDNHIHHGGQVCLSAIGIAIQHAHGNLVAHNHIHDFYYTAISCGWVWGFAESVTRENRIEKNHLHDLGKGVISDMGGVYLLGIQPGTRVSGNLVHDIVACNYGGWGIYPDEGSSHIVIENNITYNTSCQAFHQHFGRENTIRNNIWAFGHQGLFALSRGKNFDLEFPHPGVNSTCALTFTRNIVITDNQPVFVGGLADKSGNLENPNFESDLNLFFDVSGKAIYSGNGLHGKSGRAGLTRAFELEEWRELGYDRHSIVADPGFADLKAFDFTLAADSPAFDIGFQPIDMSDVGPRPANQRTD